MIGGPMCIYAMYMHLIDRTNVPKYRKQELIGYWTGEKGIMIGQFDWNKETAQSRMVVMGRWHCSRRRTAQTESGWGRDRVSTCDDPIETVPTRRSVFRVTREELLMWWISAKRSPPRQSSDQNIREFRPAEKTIQGRKKVVYLHNLWNVTSRKIQ